MSNLLKFAKIQKDDDFISKVSAAMLIRAREITGWELSDTSRNMVTYVEANPLVSVPDMVLAVAVNASVINAVDISHGVADSAGVPDDAVQFVVNEQWDAVAAKIFPAS